MPISSFQEEVLLLLKAQRNPDSYVAGGVAVHRSPTSIRRSNDIDFFHGTDEAVAQSATSDLALLESHGYAVETVINQPSFVRALVSRSGEALKLEWVRDTAFRFFPVEADSLLGYRLHDVDLATNKCLALANRNEVRDIIDLIELDRSVISLAAACWAACGKDPGFTPEMLIDCMQRNSIIRPEALAAESLTVEITAVQLKKTWLRLLQKCRELLQQFPASDLGCVYLDGRGAVVHTPAIKDLKSYQKHFGSTGGAWPRVAR